MKWDNNDKVQFAFVAGIGYLLVYLFYSYQYFDENSGEMTTIYRDLLSNWVEPIIALVLIILPAICGYHLINYWKTHPKE